MQDSGKHLRTFASARVFRAWLSTQGEGTHLSGGGRGGTKSKSTWSAVNIRRAQEPEAEGRMRLCDVRQTGGDSASATRRADRRDPYER
jgi:hypothetical protein